jgi:hypothetical protein
MNKEIRKDFEKAIFKIHKYCKPDIEIGNCNEDNTNCPLLSICTGGTEGYAIQEGHKTFKNFLYIKKIVSMIDKDKLKAFKCWVAYLGNTDLHTIVITRNEEKAQRIALRKFIKYAEASALEYDAREFIPSNVRLEIVSENLNKETGYEVIDYKLDN